MLNFNVCRCQNSANFVLKIHKSVCKYTYFIFYSKKKLENFALILKNTYLRTMKLAKTPLFLQDSILQNLSACLLYAKFIKQ